MSLQEGLAGALADHLGVDPSPVQVMTTVLASGSVVDDGATPRW